KKTWVQALRWGSVAPTPTDSLAPTATYTSGGVEGVGFGVAAVLDAVQAVASRTNPTSANGSRRLTAPPPHGPGAGRHGGPAGPPPAGPAARSRPPPPGQGGRAPPPAPRPGPGSGGTRRPRPPPPGPPPGP